MFQGKKEDEGMFEGIVKQKLDLQTERKKQRMKKERKIERNKQTVINK